MGLQKSREPATVATVNRPSNDLWTDQRFTSTPSDAVGLAARKIASRFGLSLSVALVVATLAGIGGHAQ